MPAISFLGLGGQAPMASYWSRALIAGIFYRIDASFIGRFVGHTANIMSVTLPPAYELLRRALLPRAPPPATSMLFLTISQIPFH